MISSWLKPNSDQPVMPVWWSMIVVIGAGGSWPQPPWDWTSVLQFQPYLTGCLTRAVRLVLNTSKTASAVTATTEPASVARTGTR